METVTVKQYQHCCRTCLCIGSDMSSILTTVDNNSSFMDNTVNKTFADMLLSFTNLMLTENEELPSKICIQCQKKILDCYKFKLQCEVAEVQLKKVVKIKVENTVIDSNYRNKTQVEESNKSNSENIDLNVVGVPMNNENSNDTYCSICEKSFKNSRSYNTHQTTVHEPKLALTCSKCKLEFKSNNLLNKHKKKFHGVRQPWSCKICKKEFSTKTGVSYHMSQHDDVQKKYKCLQCDRSFVLKCGLNVHLKSSHKTLLERRPVICECGKRFVSQNSLSKHITSVHNGEKRHGCQYCDRKFSTLRAVVVHKVRTHHKSIVKNGGSINSAEGNETMNSLKINNSINGQISSCKSIKMEMPVETDGANCDMNLKNTSLHIKSTKKIKKKLKIEESRQENLKNKSNTTTQNTLFHLCNVCGRRFASKFRFNEHMNIHNGEKPFKCPETDCMSAFAMKVGLQSHLKLAHSNERPYLCTVCGASFKTSTSLRIHTRSHTGEKPYCCSICGKRYRASGHLHHHLRMHKGGDPQVCKVCNKVLSNRSSYRTHMRSHENPKDKEFVPDRPFACLECDKSFVYAKDLNIHLLLHTGNLPFNCEVCSKGFNRASNHKKHMLLHSDLRPHVCEQCGAGFITKYNLTSHVNKTHTGIRGYKCDICPSAFYDTTGLGKHKRKVHKILKRELVPTSQRQIFNGHNSSTEIIENTDNLPNSVIITETYTDDRKVFIYQVNNISGFY